MTFLFSVIFGVVLAYLWEYFCTKILKKTALIVKGQKLHHSLYGVVSILFGIVIQNIFLIGVGIGILIQHTYTDGFKFISKEG